MLISSRHLSSLLQLVKTAVFVGKDRQSDLLSYLTVDETVQSAMEKLKVYYVQRVPEKYTPYKAKSQKKIVFPVGVVANKNGDVFILDAGAACVHVVDRAVVANIRIIGHYRKNKFGSLPGY